MIDPDDVRIAGSENTNRRYLLDAVAIRGKRQSADLPPRLLRVLVIDDDRDTVEGLSRLASLWGHEVRKAYSGEEGLAVAIAYHPDLLLLDIGMPTMDGCEMAQQFRLDSHLQGCFIVAITGHADEKHRRRCYEAGVDLLLVKPVNPLVLETLLALEGDYVKRIPPSAKRSLTPIERLG